MTAFVVRRATPADWEAVRDLRLRSLRDAPDAFWADPGEESALDRAAWEQRIAEPGNATFVATADGQGLGIVGIGPHWTVEGDASLHAMWVAPPARGTGVADALVEAAVEAARDLGYAAVRLWVADGNVAAERLYRRHGFSPSGVTGTFRPPREHITEHELVMALRAQA